MDELIAALRRVGAWLIAIAVGGIGLLLIVRAILPPLARAATVFVATPGGLLLIAGTWWWLRRRKGNH